MALQLFTEIPQVPTHLFAQRPSLAEERVFGSRNPLSDVLTEESTAFDVSRSTAMRPGSDPDIVVRTVDARHALPVQTESIMRRKIAR